MPLQRLLLYSLVVALAASTALADVPAAPAFRAGRIQSPMIAESSGLVASRAHPGVFWTHNDSGNGPTLFAIDGQGKLLRTVEVAAKNFDWEDIALDDKGRIYIADIGNNAADRKEVFVHAVAEPDPAGKGNDRLRVLTTYVLRYPQDKAVDAESLLVAGGKGYIISKLRNLGQAMLMSFDLDPARPRQVLQTVGELPIRLPVTAADLSADGKWLGVLTVGGPYLFRVDGDVAKAMTVAPKQVLYANLKMEACAFTADGLLTTSEDREMFLFRWKDFGIE